MKHASRALLVLLVAAAVLPLMGSGTASAAPVPPTLQLPANNAPIQINPTFQWVAAPQAVRYRVQVATDPLFSGLVINNDTVNIRFTWHEDLPNAQLWWRVAGFDAANQLGAFSPPFTFVKSAGQPAAISPLTGGTPFDYPNTPLAFSWSSLPNTSFYRIEFDDEVTFTPPRLLEDNTVTPRYTWSAPTQFNKTLYWRVKAISPKGFESGYSLPAQEFRVAWNYRPVLLSPLNKTSPSIEEVTFDWNGGVGQQTVPGATLYDLQVSSDINFNTIVAQFNDLRTTTYTPPNTLPAGDYYWRVRAKNALGAVGNFSDPFVFRRTWPTTPVPPDGNDNVQLTYPADGATVIEPNMNWTPARLASSYEVWISVDPNFSPGTVQSCQTNHTVITGCVFVNPGQPYFWKVKPLDGPIQGVFSNRRSFTYQPSNVAMVSPADNTTFPANQPPVLTWNLQNSAQTPITNPPTTPAYDQTGIGRYLVQVYKASNGALLQQEYTYNTQFVPAVSPDFDGVNYVPTQFEWRVTAVNGVNQIGVIPGGTRSFTITPATTGDIQITSAAGVQGVVPPLLRWSVETGATSYRVYRGVRGSGVFIATQLSPYSITQNAYAHTGDNLTTGDWDFFVEAYNKDGILIDVSNVSWFRILEIPTTNLTLPQDCITNTGCPVLPDTPTLDWDPVPNATHYLVSIATDSNFTNVLPQYSTDTPFTKVTLPSSMPDNQAGSSSYFWYARPCIGNRCAPDAATYVRNPPLPSCYVVPNLAPGTPCSPVRAFIKKSREVLMISPQPPPYAPNPPSAPNPPTATSEITFKWQDYLRTNRTSNPVADQEAAYYQIQVATTATFQAGTVYTSAFTHATTYTDAQLYPDGPLFWRVQAYDNSNNPLPFPVVPGQVVKSAPRASLTSPPQGTTVANSPLFTWAAQPYAYDYQIEVFKNPELGPQPANRVNIGIDSTFTTSASPRVGMTPGTYGWRVKYRDASGNEAPWSSRCIGVQLPACQLNTVTVTAGGVTLSSPPDATLLAPNRPYFSWSTATTPFAYYRFELSNTSGFTSIVDATNTVTPAYAPAVPYANGQWYWRVWTVDGNNQSLVVSAVRTITIGEPGVTYHPMAPKRILDSRNIFGPWGDSPLVAGVPRELQVTGDLPGGVGTIVPANATAIIANVTATGSTQGSFLTVYPSDVGTPNASNLNFGAGQTIPNLVTVKLGANGAVKIATAVGAVDVIVDVVGYYDDGTVAGDFYSAMTPTRLLDSRLANGPWAGTPLVAGTPRTLQVAGSQGIPSGTTAAVMNVTVTGSTSPSFLTVYPGPGNVPQSSNLNFDKGQTIPNLVVVQLSPTGQATFNTALGSTHVIVDVVGYYGPNGDKFHVLSPTRVLDSRGPALNPANAAWTSTKLGTTPKPFVVGGINPVPITATAVVMNTTATGGTANSFLLLYPEGANQPIGSNLNFAVGQTIPNLVYVKVGPVSPQQQSRINFVNAVGQVDVIADAVGYFAAQ